MSDLRTVNVRNLRIIIKVRNLRLAGNFKEEKSGGIILVTVTKVQKEDSAWVLIMTPCIPRTPNGASSI